jgi:hypothetical protein
MAASGQMDRPSLARVGWFESDHESYRWLNDLVCIAEGGISATEPDMKINIYAGIHAM